MTAARVVNVRPMQLSEVDLRINYFHDASDEHLLTLGVDRTLLPSREKWRQFYEADDPRPLAERINYSLLWELDQEVVGFSSTDRIDFGEEAFMHLHIISPAQRWSGLGTEFVKRSVAIYLRDLKLRRLFSEPNAFNVAPNRTLQRAGFKYLFTHEATPSSINFPQVTTRWVFEPPV
jgi:RimJ/RimL family protein N-acetyltransferase